MGLARALSVVLLAAAAAAGMCLAIMRAPQVRACFDACYEAEAVVNKTRGDMVIHNSVDVRDQAQFVDVLFQWREHFKSLEKRATDTSDAACSSLHVNEVIGAVLAFVLLLAALPLGGYFAGSCLLAASAAAASVAALMHQLHQIHLAFASIIDDLRYTMSHRILPLTNQDDHYLYSLIYSSTALQKSQATAHVTRVALRLPGLDALYHIAPAHAGICCAVLALLAFWLAARCMNRNTLGRAGGEGKRR